MESIVTALIGIVCIYMGCSHRKGNISALHSYHKKRVSEENRLPFGKMVGLGLIIAGIGFVLKGGFYYAGQTWGLEICTLLSDIALVAGLLIGLGISFAAMIKYNKGVF